MIENELGLVITNISLERWFAPLSNEPQSLGRSQSADIRVPQEYRTVSRVHAKVWCDAHGGWVCDLKSMFGTSVNGVRIQPNRDTVVAVGDRLMFGILEMSLSNIKDRATPPLTSSVDEDETNDPRSNLPADVTKKLSNSEREILLWMSRGYTSPNAIARQTNRSPNTVRTQFGTIYQKLGLNTREELFQLVLRRRTS